MLKKLHISIKQTHFFSPPTVWRHIDDCLKLKTSSIPLSSVNSQQQQSTGREPPHNTLSEAVCVVVPAAAVGLEAGLDSLSLQPV